MTPKASEASQPGRPGKGGRRSHDDGDPAPGAREVLTSLSEATRELQTFASRAVREQPGAALVGALVAGFVTGGGLLSPIGMRMATGTLRAAAGNLGSLVALDLVRRAARGDSLGTSSGDDASV